MTTTFSNRLDILRQTWPQAMFFVANNTNLDIVVYEAVRNLNGELNTVNIFKVTIDKPCEKTTLSQVLLDKFFACSFVHRPKQNQFYDMFIIGIPKVEFLIRIRTKKTVVRINHNESMVQCTLSAIDVEMTTGTLMTPIPTVKTLTWFGTHKKVDYSNNIVYDTPDILTNIFASTDYFTGRLRSLIN